MSVKKTPLLYVGPGYNLFTQTQCNQVGITIWSNRVFANDGFFI